MIRGAIGLFMLLLIAGACTRRETIVVPDNEAPTVNNIPAIRIENYVNRLFIDLLGREPLDDELEREVDALRTADLATDARLALIQKLQTDTSPIEGDTTYTHAYHNHLYNLAKVRTLEGASDPEIDDVLGGLADPVEIAKLQAVKASRQQLREGEIGIEEMFARMIDNKVYDIINMNTFNFVRASFDNLFWRFPTDAEFDAGFAMVEYSQTQELLGETGSNRQEYVQILTQSGEMFEGLVIWVYRQLLARVPTTAETVAVLEDFYQHRDLKIVQQTVMVTDEYAGF